MAIDQVSHTDAVAASTGLSRDGARSVDASALAPPPPGWYGHPDDPAGIARWWDGRGWSHTTRACLAPLPPPTFD